MHAPIHGHRNSTPAPASAGSRPALRLSRARAPLRPTHTNAAAVTDAPSDQEPRSSAPQEDVSDDSLVFDVPEAIWERNRAFAQRLKGKVILAPLTRGGNLPYRELCVAHGCEATMSEMAFARNLIKGDRLEKARLVKGANESCYGFQIATKVIDEGVQAAHMAQESGASWLDINVGCPIYEASKRGLGAVMLRKPRSLAKFVHGVVVGSPLPVTVKIRTGENEKKINMLRVIALLKRAGAAAITVHGRTFEQRYRKPADWGLISDAAVQHADVPIIGNGDVLTHYDVSRRFSESNVHAVMAGRGALIRPWIFQEAKEGREFSLTATDRIGVYRQLVSLMKAHFGDDALGRRKAFYFLPWHFSFFHRYRPFPESVYGEMSRTHPLIATRMDLAETRMGESLETLDPLERLLRNENEAAHAEISALLWDSASDSEAAEQLRALASEKLLGWEEEVGRRGPLDPSRGGGQMGGASNGGARGKGDGKRSHASDEEY